MGSRDAIAKILTAIKAFHSSPHSIDPVEGFKVSKMGTGEGNQTYGPGMYYAENPKVSGRGGQYWEMFSSRLGSTPEGVATDKLQRFGFDRAKAIAAARDELDFMQKRYDALPSGVRDNPKARGLPTREALINLQAQHDLLTSNRHVGPYTYEVSIHADPNKMVNWDAKLGQQHPAIQDYFRKQLEQYGPDAGMAAQLKIASSRSRGGLQSVTEGLQEAGVPGTRYLDQGSRDMANDAALYRRQLEMPGWTDQARAQMQKNLERLEGKNLTSNYVIYDPQSPQSRVTIDKKYAVPAAVGTGAVMGSAFDQGTYEEPRR